MNYLSSASGPPYALFCLSYFKHFLSRAGGACGGCCTTSSPNCDPNKRGLTGVILGLEALTVHIPHISPPLTRPIYWPTLCTLTCLQLHSKTQWRRRDLQYSQDINTLSSSSLHTLPKQQGWSSYSMTLWHHLLASLLQLYSAGQPASTLFCWPACFNSI